MSAPAKASKKQGGAPEWHFADEESAQGDQAGPGSSYTLTANNKFIIRGALVLLLLIAAMYTFDFKEIRALNSSQKPSTWFADKPHWQSTEEMKLRMAKRDGHHPDIFPGQQAAGEGGWLNSVNTEEWMDRMDAEVEEEMRNKQLVDDFYDGPGYADYN